MPNIDELIRDRLSKDGQVLNLKAQFLREVGAIELVQKESLKEVRALDLSQNGIGDEGVKALAQSTVLVNLRNLNLASTEPLLFSYEEYTLTLYFLTYFYLTSYNKKSKNSPDLKRFIKELSDICFNEWYGKMIGKLKANAD